MPSFHTPSSSTLGDVNRFNSLGIDPRVRVRDHVMYGLAHEVEGIVWTAHPDGVVEFVNSFAKRFAANSLVGIPIWSWVDVIAPEDFMRVSQEVRSSIESGRTFEVNCTVVNSVGERIPVCFQGAPARDRNRRIFSWIGTALPVDRPSVHVPPDEDRKFVMGLSRRERAILDGAEGEAAAAKLKAERLARRLEFLAEASRELSSSLDIQTVLSNLSRFGVPRLGDWLGVQELQSDGALLNLAHFHRDPALFYLGWTMRIKYVPTDFSKVQYGSFHVLRTGQAQLQRDYSEEVMRLLGQNEEVISFLNKLGFHSWIVAPLRARGRIIGTMSFTCSTPDRQYDESDVEFAEEIVQRLAMAIDNANLYKEAQRVNEVKDEFLATLSHELRTPLNVIMGYSELLSSTWSVLDPNEIQSSLDAIQRNSRAELQIMDDLLNVSSLIMGKIQLKPMKFSLGELIRKSVDSLRVMIESKRLRVHVNTERAPLETLGDPDRLHQVVINLLTNAIKYTPAGGFIEVILKQSDQNVTLTVRDTGYGIDPTFLPYVFDRFRQEDNSSTRQFGGLGLGLAIVRNLVELHGGTVQVRSAGRDLGSEFTVTLPADSGSLVVAQESVQAPAQLYSVPPDLKGVQVLVVEDDEDTRHLIRRTLEFAGAHVVQASSASEAIELYKLSPPDVILSDIGMPEKDGLDLIRQIRDLESKSIMFTPAAAITAHAREEDQQSALGAGFQAFVAKPVNRFALTSVVLELLENVDQSHSQLNN